MAGTMCITLHINHCAAIDLLGRIAGHPLVAQLTTSCGTTNQLSARPLYFGPSRGASKRVIIIPRISLGELWFFHLHYFYMPFRGSHIETSAPLRGAHKQVGHDLMHFPFITRKSTLLWGLHDWIHPAWP